MKLYLDEDSGGRWLRDGLRTRGFDVETALEADTVGYADDRQLLFATEGGRVLVTANQGDFFRIHTARLREGRRHAGIVICPQRLAPGPTIAAFEALRDALDETGLDDRIEFLNNWVPSS